MEVCDIEALARDLLEMDRGAPNQRWHYRCLSRDEVERPGAGTFDRRLRMNAFLGTHCTFCVTDGVDGQRVGSTTIFVLHSQHFDHVRFWRSILSAGGRAWEKISLGELSPYKEASTVVMHGYIEGPSVLRRDATEMSYGSWAVGYRYIQLLIRLAQLCSSQHIPMLIEATGRAALEESRRSKLRLTADDLTAEEIAGIGVTRRQSLPAERMARRFGLCEVPDVWNERTFGKVYCSVPALDEGLRPRSAQGTKVHHGSI